VISTSCLAFSLHTNSEHIAQNRKWNGDHATQQEEIVATRADWDPYTDFIQWVDPSLPLQNQLDNSIDDDECVLQDMPLYPLDAVYLPYGNTVADGALTEYHYLNNVEPRNLHMAMDLTSSDHREKGIPPVFCAVLRASDTGRIATVGTILRIVEATDESGRDLWGAEQSSPSSEALPQRIRVKCVVEDIASICEVLNPDAATSRARILRSDEYIRVKVKRRSSTRSIDAKGEDDASVDTGSMSTMELISAYKAKIAEDYRMIKIIYEIGVGSQLLPLNGLSEMVSAMPLVEDFDAKNEDGEDGGGGTATASEQSARRWLLTVVQTWQSVCYTWRAGRQALLAADRNELMIDAACRNGGPLKLPVHMADLSPEDRRNIEGVDLAAQHDYLQLRLDPTLDFQVLLSMLWSSSSLSMSSRLDFATEPWRWVSRLLAQERKRLEDLAAQPTAAPISSLGTDGGDDELVDEDLMLPNGWFFDENEEA